MKGIMILTLAVIMNISCNAQENKKEENLHKDKNGIAQISEPPKGTWKVDKQFDKDGNLTRYDSIYSWSSKDNLEGLSSLDRDSTLESMQSKFYHHFSQFGKQGFDDIFSADSLFTKRFFDDDFFTSEFGEDFMDIDKMKERMEAVQEKFLEKYRSELNEPGKESSEENI